MKAFLTNRLRRDRQRRLRQERHGADELRRFRGLAFELLEDRRLLALANPNFATGDLTGWSASGAPGVVSVTDAYVVDGLTGGAEHYRAVSRDDPYFAILRGEPLEVTLQQSFSANSGDRLTGWAYFDAQATTPPQPSVAAAQVRIESALGPAAGSTVVFQASSQTVGRGGQTGWTYWEHTFVQSGDFVLRAAISDASFYSWMGLDALAQYSGPGGGGTGVGPVTDIDPAPNTVSEAFPVGTPVGITAVATDPDPIDTVRYSLSNNAGGRFAINNLSGVVTMAQRLDAETTLQHTVEVTAVSSDGSVSRAEFVITVKDVSESPVGSVSDVDGTANAAAEDAVWGTAVGLTARAIDPDVFDTVTYSLSNNAQGRFDIHANTGVVTVVGPLDAETAPQHTIEVTALSSDGSSSMAEFTIVVTDVNEPLGLLADLDAAPNRVAEDASVGATVGLTARAIDPDSADTVSYSLSDTAGGRFAIDTANGLVTVAAPLDAELAASHAIEVTATSSDGGRRAAAYTIAVTDVNEWPMGPIADADALTDEVPENAAVGTAVGITAQATDPDATDTVTYRLSNSAGGQFAIHAGTGRVTVAAALDAETATSHTIEVTAASTDGSSRAATFTIAVRDVNESSVSEVSDTDGAANQVAENAAVGTTVGISALASDPDVSDTVSYSLSNSAGGRFAIHAGTGLVTVAAALDAETATSHTIEVTAASSDGSTRRSPFAIAVVDVNEYRVGAVTDGDTSTDGVGENAAIGALVFITAVAADADVGDTVDYRLSNSAGGLFAIDSGTGELTVAGPLDAETAASHAIEVTATSTDGSSSTSPFVIPVWDVNEAPVGAVADVNVAPNEVAENAAAGSAVGIQVLATDPDVSASVSYRLTDTAGGRFAIDANTGVVSVAGALDAELAASHTVEVTATSSDGSTSRAQFTITVADVDEPLGPVTDSDAAANLVHWSAARGALVGVTARAVEPDANQTVTYRLTDDAGGLFAIDSASGIVTVAASLETQTATDLSIEITAASSDGGTSTAPFQITLQPFLPLVNSSFATFDLTGWTSSANGAFVTNAYYADGMDFKRYESASADDNGFAVVRGGFSSGTLSQTFSARAGDVLSGWAFFDTQSGTTDNAQIRVKSGSTIVATVVDESAQSVGTGGETGWVYWEHMFANTGEFTLEARVAAAAYNVYQPAHLGLDDVALNAVRQVAIVGQRPAVSVRPLASVQVDFSVPMDHASFSPADDVVSFTGPGGSVAVTDYAWIDADTIELRFAPQPSGGDYHLVIGPEIASVYGWGLGMAQTLTWTVTAPRVVGQTPSGLVAGSIDAVRLDFSIAIDHASFAPQDDVVGFAGPRGPVAVTSHQWMDANTLELRFAPQYAAGRYDLTIGPAISNSFGVPMSGAHTAAFFLAAPRIVGHVPVGVVPAPVSVVQVNFNHAMDQTSFSPEDDVVSFAGPDGPLVVLGFQWQNDRALNLFFQPQFSPGQYQLVVGSRIEDLWSTPLDQDQDLRLGEMPDDLYTVAFSISAPKVLAHSPAGSTPRTDRVTFTFDQPMLPESFAPGEDVARFDGPNGSVSIRGHHWLDSRTLEITFDQPVLAGSYEMVIGPRILNQAGIPLDQDGDSVSGEDLEDRYTASFSQTDGSTTIAVDSVLGPLDAPAVLGGDLTVAPGVTLTIDAGTILKFSNQGGLVVRGNLHVRGTVDQPVILTSIRDDAAGGDTNGDGSGSSPRPRDWSGIQVAGTGIVTLEHAEIRYAETGLDADAEGARAVLRNTILRDGEMGIYVYSPYVEIEAENCLIANNLYTGLYVRADSRHVFRNCTIVGNGFDGSGQYGAGVHLGGASLTLDNTIVAFNRNGLDHAGDPPLLTIRHSDFYNPNGHDIVWNGDPGMPQLDRDGNLTTDPRFVDRLAGNYELAAGSPAIDAGRGINAPARDLLERSRYDDQGMPNVGNGYPVFVDIGAYERQASSSSADLSVTFVSNPVAETVSAGDTFDLVWSVRNVGAIEAAGTWRDVVYLSDDPYLGNDELVAAIDHDGSLAAGADYTETHILTIPATSGPKYVLLHVQPITPDLDAVDTNNLGVATRVLAVDVPLLELDRPLAATATAGQWAYYRFEATLGQPVLFTLDGSTGTAGLYLRRDLPPTLAGYDAAAAAPQQADQELRLLEPAEGTYYIGVLPGARSGAYTISARVPAFGIRAISPNTVGNAGHATLEILGDQFSPEVVVQMVAPDGATIAGEVTHWDSATLSASFDLGGADAVPGLYDVVVTNPGPASAARPDALTVVDGGGGDFTASISMPAVTRPGRVVSVWVDYRNLGTVDVAMPLLSLVGSEGIEWLLPGSVEWVMESTVTFAVPASEQADGILRPGERGSTLVKMRTPFEPGDLTVELFSSSAPAAWEATSDPINWNAIEASVRPTDAEPGTWEAIWTNLVANVGNTWAGFLAMAAHNARLIPPEIGSSRSLVDLLSLEVQRTAAAVTTSISGRLLPGEPIDVAGRAIVAWNAASTQSVSTYSLNDGSFYLPQLAPGTFELTVTDYLTLSDTPFTVAANQHLEGADLSVVTGSSLSGRVRQGSDGPIVPGAVIVAVAAAGREMATVTDSLGRYRIEGLLPDTYALIVDAVGMARVELPGLVIGSEATLQDITLWPESVIAGQVHLEAGGPGSDGLSIAASSTDPTSGLEWFTAQVDGTAYHFDHLAAGIYDIRFVLNGYQTATIEDVSIQVGQSRQLDPVELELGSVVSGTVNSTVAEFPAWASTLGMFQDGTMVATTQADATGYFAFYGAEAGDYHVRVLYPRAGVSTMANVAVDHGEDVPSVAIAVVPGASIVGTLVDTASGLPIAAIPVVLRFPDGQTRSTITDDQGAYRFDRLDLGPHLVSLPLPGAPYLQSIDVTAIDGTAFTADFELAPQAWLRGRALLADGSPAATVTVRLLDGDVPLAASTANADGEFAFAVMRGGSYSLHAVGQDATFTLAETISIEAGESRVRDLIAGSASLQVAIDDALSGPTDSHVVVTQMLTAGPIVVKSLTLAAGQQADFQNLAAGEYRVSALAADGWGASIAVVLTAEEHALVQLPLQQQSIIAGQVVDSAGLSVPGAWLVLHSESDGMTRAGTAAGPDGRFELAGLDVGTYDLVVWAAGFSAVVQTGVSIPAATDWIVRLDASAATLTGQLVDAAGLPVPDGEVTVLDAAGHILGMAISQTDGSFVISSVSGVDLVLQVSLPGGVAPTLPGLTLAGGSQVDLGSLVVEPVALGYVLGPWEPADILVAIDWNALPPGRWTYHSPPLPEWSDYFGSDFERQTQREVTLAELPPLAPECGLASVDLYLALLNAIPIQERAWDYLHRTEGTVDALRIAVPGLLLAEIGITIDNVASAIELGVSVRNLFRTVHPPELPRHFEQFEQAKAILWDIGEPMVQLLGVLYEAVTSDQPDDLMVQVNRAEEIAGHVLSMVTAAVDLIRVVSPYASMFELLDLINSLKEAVHHFTLSDFRQHYDELIREHAEFQRAIERYTNSIRDANRLLQQYQAAIADCRDPDGTQEKEDEARSRNYTSRTPEDKFGPAGYDDPKTASGSELRYIPAGETLSYRVEFWNKEDAPVPTQDAVIEDVLDPAVFDLSSFALTRIGFLQWDVPWPGGQAIDTRIDLRPEMNLAVEVKANFDSETGRIDWWFHAVDPVTGDYPEDPFAGFLPPYNPETGFEIGWVEFRVDHVSDLASGTRIENQAFVEFDFAGDLADHPAPKEGPWVNSIDAGPPTSQILPLQATTDQAAFLVQWSGADETGGSGVAGFDVYVATDGGDFVRWLDDSTATSAVFAGERGRTYSFYSVATDNVGHREPTPPVADAMITTTPVNTPPVAIDDFAITDADSVLIVAVLANDSDEQGNLIPECTVRLTDPAAGRLTNNMDGTFTYHPDGEFERLGAGEFATVSFNYQIQDSYFATAAATAFITIIGVNDVPTVTVQHARVAVAEGQTANNRGTFADVDATDSIAILASIGTVTWDAANHGGWSWSFDTTDGPVQAQVVTITADDGHGGIATTTFDLTVTNVAPIAGISLAEPDSAIVKGQPVHFRLAAHDVSPADQAAGFTFAIDWGDGLATTTPPHQPDGLTVNHVFVAAGTVTVIVIALDKDGDAGAAVTVKLEVVQPIVVDVKPGDAANKINVKSQGVIPVAVYSTADFDARRVDTRTLKLAGVSPDRFAFEDLDRDGDLDLVLHFRTQEVLDTIGAALAPGDSRLLNLELTGETVDEVLLRGFDTVEFFLPGKSSGSKRK